MGEKVLLLFLFVLLIFWILDSGFWSGVGIERVCLLLSCYGSGSESGSEVEISIEMWISEIEVEWRMENR